MESFVLLVFVMAWSLLGVLAFRFGHDSRDGIDRPPDGALWRRPTRELKAASQRLRRDWEHFVRWPKTPQRSLRPVLAAYSPHRLMPASHLCWPGRCAGGRRAVRCDAVDEASR
jgi:hypothetical protein